MITALGLNAAMVTESGGTYSEGAAASVSGTFNVSVSNSPLSLSNTSFESLTLVPGCQFALGTGEPLHRHRARRQLRRF